MTNPHDEFARFIFGQPENAIAELRHALPHAITSEVDWSTLKREADPEVAPKLRKSESGLAFSAHFFSGTPVIFLMILKSKSTPEDHWMALRMMRYTLDQLERWREAHPEKLKLPPVVPLLVYFGKDGKRMAPHRLDDLFNLPQA